MRALLVIDYTESCCLEKYERPEWGCTFGLVRALAPRLERLIQVFRQMNSGEVVWIRCCPWIRGCVHPNIEALNADVGWFRKQEERDKWARTWLGLIERTIAAGMTPVCLGPALKETPAVSGRAHDLLLELIQAAELAAGDELRYQESAQVIIAARGEEAAQELAEALSALKATKELTNGRIAAEVHRLSSRGNVAVLIGADHIEGIARRLKLDTEVKLMTFKLEHEPGKNSRLGRE